MGQPVTSKIFIWNQFPAGLAKRVVHFEITQRINVWNDYYFILCVYLYLIEGPINRPKNPQRPKPGIVLSRPKWTELLYKVTAEHSAGHAEQVLFSSLCSKFAVNRRKLQ